MAKTTKAPTASSQKKSAPKKPAAKKPAANIETPKEPEKEELSGTIEVDTSNSSATTTGVTAEPVEAGPTKTETEAEPVKIGPSVFPFHPADVPKLVLLDKEKLPKGMEVDLKRKAVTIHFEGTTTTTVLNTLNHYTTELRHSFNLASMLGWKAIFLVNDKRYISTLNKVTYEQHG